MRVKEEAVMREVIEYALDDIIINALGECPPISFKRREQAVDFTIEQIKKMFEFEGAEDA